MTLKIDRISDEQGHRIRLSGELRSDRLLQVRVAMQLEESFTLDLEEVCLVDVDAVRFLNACEIKGIDVLHCSPYIREWMLRERRRQRKY